MAVGLSLFLSAIIENLSSFAVSLSCHLPLPLFICILMDQLSILVGRCCAVLKEGMRLSAFLL